MEITAKERIEMIIEKGLTDSLVNYPIDTIITFFKKTEELFVKPSGWQGRSEEEKSIILVEWFLKRFQRNAEVEFLWASSVHATLKKWVISAMEFLEESEQ